MGSRVLANRFLLPAKVATIALVALLGVLASLGAMWKLSGDLNCHDPAIYKEGNTWWIFRTWGAGIGVDWSTDGHQWNSGTPIYESGLPWWGQYNGNSAWTWAPSVVDYKGKALCYYAVSTFGSQNSAIGLTTASSIGQGDWVDQGPVITSGNGSSYNAIDPCFVQDAAGSPWLSFGSWWKGIYLTQLDPHTFKQTGYLTNIAYNDGGIENSQIVYKDGYYYLFASVGTCCDGSQSTYHIVYGRSRVITGPYLDKKGVSMLSGGGSTLDAGNGRYIAPGGESIYNNNGQWICARHELDSENNYSTVLFINDLSWVGDWPTYTLLQ
jgi:arabinan endo-1,5-alpha-L-arabinosidase